MIPESSLLLYIYIAQSKYMLKAANQLLKTAFSRVCHSEFV